MARRSCGLIPGFTILELLLVLAIAGTLTAVAVPQGLRALDDFRVRSAARYLAQRLGDARLQAIKRSRAHGLRFEPGPPDYRLTMVADGNGNGLRLMDLQRGIDRALTETEMLGSHFQDVAFGILQGVPDADGQPANGADGVRIGSSTLLTMNPDGTSTSGTLYVHGRDRAQYAVRVLGVTGRVRVLKFDSSLRRWIDQ
ncbi:MAG: prepilin-type N-terminal cleavage/methylation domain-containing protein [Vicinamibacterales bacterium]